MLTETLKFWWSEHGKLPLVLGIGALLGAIVILSIYLHTPLGTVSGEVTSVFHQHKGKPLSTVSVQLSNGTLASIGPIPQHIERGETLCLQVRENMFGLKQHRFLHVGNCT